MTKPKLSNEDMDAIKNASLRMLLAMHDSQALLKDVAPLHFDGPLYDAVLQEMQTREAALGMPLR